MRAIRTHAYGGVEQLQLEDIPIPVPKPDEVLVRIAASTVNPVDWKMRSGAAQKRLPLTFPITLGCDFSGVVAQLGEGVTSFNIGDEVYGYCGVQRDGSYAEYVALPAAHTALRPRTLTLLESAAVPLGSLTAYIALFEDAGLQSGQRVLIHAAAGSVGSMAVQLAKAAGAIVYATGSAGSEQLIRSLGADVFINYRTQQFEDVAQDLDVVLDTMGGETGDRSWRCLRAGGYMACVATPPDKTLMQQYRCRGTRSNARPDGALLARFAAMVDAGQLRPIIDRVLPLQQIQEAHRLSESGHMHGKIVLQICQQ
jgi:NADPH:quinone reductase-like Zn-dependent oxidoreductase